VVNAQVDADGEFKRSTGMFNKIDLPEDDVPTPPRASMSAQVVTSDPSHAREQMETLLRMLVKEGGSDLHMRVGEPPILRKSGEMHRVEGMDESARPQPNRSRSAEP
jgi:hypothetical protein